jgi:hypothetical protein
LEALWLSMQMLLRGCALSPNSEILVLGRGLMGLFQRRQGPVATAAAVAEFAPADRERGLDLLQHAESVFVDIRAPSRLGTAVVSVALLGLGIEENDSIYGPSLGAALLGYACRMGQTSPPRPDNDLARVERHLIRDASGSLDYEAMSDAPDRLRGLVDYVAELDVARFQRLLGNSPQAWEVFCVVATQQLHRNLSRNGVPRRHLPPGEAVRVLLQLGYPIRFIDETAGAEPYRASAVE